MEIDKKALGNAESTCDPPFRGGMRIYPTDETQECTLGPIARSRTNDKPYVFTAGHCGEIGDVFKSPNVSAGLGTFSTVGTMHNRKKEGKTLTHPFEQGADVAILNLESGDDSTVHPWIYTERSTTGSVKRNAKFVVTGMRTSFEGQVLCIAGATSGSHCGRVPREDGLGHRRGNSGYVRMCSTAQNPGGLNQGATRGGDSGAPLFAKTGAGGSTVHGTLIGLKDAAYACVSEFQSLKAASEDLNVYVVTNGNLNTPLCSGGKKKNIYGSCD